MIRASSGAWRAGFALWLSACSVYDAGLLTGEPSTSSSGSSSSGSAGAGGSADPTTAGSDVSSSSDAAGTGGTAGASGTGGAGGAAGTATMDPDASFDAPTGDEMDRGPMPVADANDGSTGPAIDAPPTDARPNDAIVANDTSAVAVLEAHWRFDEGTGTMTADATGHGHTGRLQGGAAWQSGKIAGAIGVDVATSGYVDVPEAVIDTLQPYSVAVWILFRRVTDPHQTIVSIDGASVSAFFLQLSGGRITFYTKSTDSPTAGDFLIQAIDPALVNTWYHVVGVRDASRLTLYVNGVLQGSRAFTSIWAGRGSTVIGRGKWAGNLQDYVSGTIDDVRLYRGVLTAQEIAALATP